TVAAPILVQFDVPLIAGHMFVFYFGIIADITPPVCLAAYAASGLAGSNPFRTGTTAFKLAIAAFIIPFMFVIEPSLLLQDVTVGKFVPSLVTAIIGMAAISGGLIGFRPAGDPFAQRCLLIIGGLLLVYPSVLISTVGLVVLAIAVAAVYVHDRRRDQRHQTPAST